MMRRATSTETPGRPYGGGVVLGIRMSVRLARSMGLFAVTDRADAN
jgi:hypothetical protein